MAETTFVIVGASLAGAKAAATLRDEGFEGPVVLIGEEPVAPYERPPLSKGYLRGESDFAKALVHDDGFYDRNGIELRSGAHVAQLDTAAKRVTLDSGEHIPYERALLATGAQPRRLPLRGADLPGVHYLRTVADADTLRDAIERARAMVVIGAGWIGAEVAASARQKGLAVTLLDVEDVPLARVLGLEIGAIYRDIHTDQGVRFLGGGGVDRIEGSGAVERVVTSDGDSIDCDVVVVGIGVVPRVELARSAGLDVDNGVLVSRFLESSVPGVFAAGDIANAWHPFYRRHMRVEHWANALNQGVAAARNMLGKAEAYERLPYFYSDQYDVGMEYSGDATGWDDIVVRGDPAAREFVAFWLKRRRVIAGMNVNVWDVTDDIQALIRSRASVDRSRLADPDVPLADLARSSR